MSPTRDELLISRQRYKATLKAVIQYVADDAMWMALPRTRAVNTGVVFVTSDAYPDGAYRVHASHFMPLMMANNFDFGSDVVTEAVLELNDPRLVWDRESLWLTIVVQRSDSN